MVSFLRELSFGDCSERRSSVPPSTLDGPDDESDVVMHLPQCGTESLDAAGF